MRKSPKGLLLLLVPVVLAVLLIPSPVLAEDGVEEPAAVESAGDASGVDEGYSPEAVSDDGAVGEEGEPNLEAGENPGEEISLDAQDEERSGTFNGMDWRITVDGVLVLGKAGEEQEFSRDDGMSEDDWPWYESRSFIAFVRVEGSVHVSGSLRYMFHDCPELFMIDLSGLDISAVTDMSGMFSGCPKLSALDLSGLDISAVTDMSGMFSGCSSLAALDLSGLDTSNVTDMSGMFCLCSSLSSIDVTGWDTSSVTNMSHMLAFCPSLSSLDVSGWDTSSVVDMSTMFLGCASLSSLDVSGWDVSSVTGMRNMFIGCPLSYLDVSDWDVSSVADMYHMFESCTLLSYLDVSGWDTSSVTNMEAMFSSCRLLSYLDVSGWDTSSVTSMSGMFASCASLSYLDLSGWNTGAVVGTSRMFSDCSSLCLVKLGEGCIKMGELPSPSATDGRWRSETESWEYYTSWYTPSQIIKLRLGIADTYTCCADTKPVSGFTDADAYTPHLEDILWLAANGISTGYDEWDGTRTFRGMDPVFRQDMAAFLYRLAGKPAYVPTQADVAKFRDVNWSTPHATEIWWLASAGISEGWDMHDGTFEFRGRDTVKRQDMAAFLRRLAKWMGVDDTDVRLTNPFRDVNAGTAHYRDILWLAYAGVSKGWDLGNGISEFRGMDSVKRQDMAAFLHRLDVYVKRSVA